LESKYLPIKKYAMMNKEVKIKAPLINTAKVFDLKFFISMNFRLDFEK
jgi:hypothetical protein